MIRPAELIERKRDGEELAPGEIAERVLGYARGEIPDKLLVIAAQLKDFGNVGTHAGPNDLGKGEVAARAASAVQPVPVRRRSQALLEAEPRDPDRRGSLRRYGRPYLEVIERFGRFPHRNKVLGRESTPAEIAFLAERQNLH